MRYRLPLTLRVIYHAWRAIVVSTVLALAAWMFLVPASDTEQQALGVRAGIQWPEGLRPMRMARVILTVAPDSTLDKIADAMGPGASRALVEMALRDLAAGPAARHGNTTPEGGRDIDGPKFVHVEQP